MKEEESFAQMRVMCAFQPRAFLTSTFEFEQAVQRLVSGLSSKSAAVIASDTMMKRTVKIAETNKLIRCGIPRHSERIGKMEQH